MIQRCDDDDLAQFRNTGRGLTCALIVLDENVVTAALVNIDHMSLEPSPEHVHILRHHRVDTNIRHNHLPSMAQLEQALSACLDETNLASWPYNLLILRLPFSVSHLVDVDQHLDLDPKSLLTRIHNPLIELAREAQRSQIQGDFIATDLGDRKFTPHAGPRLHDAAQPPAERLHFTGKLVVSEQKYCTHVCDLLTRRNIHPHLILSGPLSLRGFLAPQERHADRIAVLYLDHHAAHAAIFDEGGLRHIGHYPFGTDTLARAARRHAPGFRPAHREEWSRINGQITDDLAPDIALSFSALDQACAEYAPGVVTWFHAFAARAEQADSHPLHAIKVVSEENPVALCVVRHAMAFAQHRAVGSGAGQSPTPAWNVVAMPSSAADFIAHRRMERPPVALRECALAQEVCAMLEGADPLDFAPMPTALTAARTHLVLGLNDLSRWTTYKLPGLLRSGARRIGTGLYTGSRRAGTALRNRLRHNPPA